jgi:hypothetical protein
MDSPADNLKSARNALINANSSLSPSSYSKPNNCQAQKVSPKPASPDVVPAPYIFKDSARSNHNAPPVDDNITTLLECAEHRALCAAIIGARDIDVPRRSKEYRAFSEALARIEGEKKDGFSYHSFPRLEAKKAWDAYWW